VTEVLLQEDTDGVRVLTLNRPGARNALSSPLVEALHAALLAADAQDQVRVLVMTGADPAFCAGIDLKEAARAGGDYFRRAGTADCIAQVGLVSKPVIGAVNGATFTGGLELALGCDFLIASDRAIFADTHARVGLLPRGGMTARLPRVVGGAWARWMSMTGQVIDAARAERIGLVTEVVPHDQLLPRVMDCARAIAEVPPDTVRGLKQMYDTGARTTLGPALAAEREIAARHVPDWAGLEQRRIEAMARNRAQIAGGQK
jgi:enoyl-CoA hydratase/carnithine racemase